MSYALLEKVYNKAPIIVQNAACSYYGWLEKHRRLNRSFEEKLEWLRETEYWPASKIEEYRFSELERLIRHCYAHVPYYRRTMKSLGLTPNDFKSVDDLKKLPILTKEDVRRHREELLADNARRSDVTLSHTSGTTGKSLHFYVTKQQIPFQWAIWWRHRGRFGVTPADWHVNFTGKIVVPVTQTHPPFWRWNWPMHQVVVPMHHVSEQTVGHIVEFINGFGRPLFFSGYPSIISAFCELGLSGNRILTNSPGLVFTGAENTLDYQADFIHSFTGALVTSQYGFSEGCGNASQCPELVYHEDHEFGIMECVDPEPPDMDGRVRGRIVCTGFASPDFPFLRYDVGDLGLWEKAGTRCRCGRETAVLVSIEGRRDDYVLTPEGRKIMRFDYIFKDTQSVKECQVVQERLGQIKIRIVRRSDYSKADENVISGEVAKWISPKLEVVYEYVDSIQRETNGKFKAVMSLIG